jgi:CubicO group peptidase (beta-lactamase class C family)
MLRLTCAVALAASLSACSSSDGGSEQKSNLGNDAGTNAEGLDFTAFDAAVTDFLNAHGLKGASGVVVQKERGIVHTQGYGSYAPDRLYLIASSSKILSVGILLRLMDAGKLDIDAPIGNYLSAWGTGKPELEVAQLVSNSSGLVSLTDNPVYLPYICQYVESGSLTDCAKSIYTANDAADRKPPDSSFHYGGGPWQLAGGIAEFVSGKKWSELVKETYVDPCGAPSIGYTNQYQRAASAGGDGGSVAAGLSYPAFFGANAANLPASDNPSVEGGAYVKAEDYGKILLMHLRGGTCGDKRVLSADAVARMQKDRIKEKYDGNTGGGGTFDGYGMGWWIDRNHPGVFADPGAYGAMPWLDLPRGYGAFIVIEASADLGALMYTAVKPTLDAVFDGEG